MLKRILFASLFLSSTIAMAAPVAYVGGGLGITVNTNNKGQGSYRGMPLNVLAGYGGLIGQSFYLAGELNGTLATATIMSSGKLKTSYSMGASILPGVMLSDDTLAFVRAGLVSTSFTSANVNLSGAQIGLGMETSVTQNIDVRGEYDFTDYASSSKISNATPPVSVAARGDAFNVAVIYKFQ